MNTLTQESYDFAIGVLVGWIAEDRTDTSLLLQIKEAHIRRTSEFIDQMGICEEERLLAKLIAELHDLAFFISDDEKNHVKLTIDILFG